jgi:hypothetical protein
MPASREARVLDRLGRRESWEGFFAPWALALAGAAISIAFLFQRSLSVRAVMFACFLAVAWLSGKKVSLLATALVSAGIVAANLLVPVGKVVAYLGPMRITETALVDGIGKALIFEGLIYVSKACVLPGLRIPGRFGSLVAASFVYYDRIVEYKGKVRPAHLVEDADALMLELWDEALGTGLMSEPKTATAALSAPVRAPVGGLASSIVLIIAVLASFALLLVK